MTDEKKTNEQDVNQQTDDRTGQEPIPVWKQLGLESEAQLIEGFRESRFKMDALEQELAKKPKELVIAPSADDILKAIDRQKLDDDPEGAINDAVKSVLAKQKVPVRPEPQQRDQGVPDADRQMLDRTIKEVRAEAEKEGLDSGAVFGIMLDIAEKKPFLSRTEGGVREIGKQAITRLRGLVKPENIPPEHGMTGGASSATINRRGDGTPSGPPRTFEQEAKDALMEAAKVGRVDDVNAAVFAQHAKLLEQYHKKGR